jgi:leucyl-tRNA synthetase
MSKSRGNVVNPDSYVSELGADTVRAYLMFIGPWEQGGEWDDRGINGMSRWLNRVWNLVLQGQESALPKAAPDQAVAKELRHRTHKTIKKVTEDLGKFRYNTMLAHLMEFSNYLGKVLSEESVDAHCWREASDALILLLAPTAPHLAEELWARTGRAYSIHQQRLPEWDEGLSAEEQITFVIQINGKVRDKVTVPASIGEAEARELALSQPRVKAFLEGKNLASVVYVPQKLVNLVVK